MKLAETAALDVPYQSSFEGLIMASIIEKKTVLLKRRV